MFTIVYESGARVWDVPKRKLYEHITTSELDIAEVYEQATPVTKRIRKELAALDLKNTTAAARRFINSPP